jgi:hypothetical protein
MSKITINCWIISVAWDAIHSVRKFKGLGFKSSRRENRLLGGELFGGLLAVHRFREPRQPFGELSKKGIDIVRLRPGGSS